MGWMNRCFRGSIGPEVVAEVYPWKDKYGWHTGSASADRYRDCHKSPPFCGFHRSHLSSTSRCNDTIRSPHSGNARFVGIVNVMTVEFVPLEYISQVIKEMVSIHPNETSCSAQASSFRCPDCQPVVTASSMTSARGCHLLRSVAIKPTHYWIMIILHQ